MNPQKIKKWNRWLGNANSEGTIAYELGNLAVIREIHSGLREMVDNNKDLQKHSAFYYVIQMTYSQSALMYIRRQVRRNCDSVSLIMLADDILKEHRMITKEFFSNMYVRGKHEEQREGWKRLGECDFAKHFGGTCGDCIDPLIIEKDIQVLKKVSDDSSEFTDRRLAHLDRREPTIIPTYSEIDSWCQVLNKILRKYMLLLQAVDYKIVPILQHDWKSIFRVAWL